MSSFFENTELVYEPIYKLAEIRSYSEDGLIDTIRYCSQRTFYDENGYIDHTKFTYDVNGFNTYHFSRDNKLLREESGHEEDYGYSGWQYFSDYSYDNEGRVVQITFFSEATGFESINYDYSTIRMTEKGYIHENREYELDSLGRVTLIRYSTHLYGDSLVELDGEKYYYNSNNITYTDSSCTTLGYFHAAHIAAGTPDHWVKSVYLYNERGDLKSYTSEGSLDGINWKTAAHDEYKYTYKTSPKSTTGNTQIEKASNTKVYGVDGAIMVISESNAPVRIYNIYGQLVKQEQVSDRKSVV